MLLLALLCTRIGAAPSADDVCTTSPDNAGTTGGMTRYRCIYGNLTSFPDPTTFKLASNLQLTGNQITSFPDSLAAGGGLVTLHELYIEKNLITEVKYSQFKGLGTLTLLYLGSNKLSGAFGADMPFADMVKLNTVYIGNNQITSVISGIFDTNSQLQMVDFEGNPMVMLPAHIFDKNTHLMFVTLTNTNIYSLPDRLFEFVTGMIEGSVDISKNCGAGICGTTPLLFNPKPMEGEHGFELRNFRCKTTETDGKTLTNNVVLADGENTCCVLATVTNCLEAPAPAPAPHPDIQTNTQKFVVVGVIAAIFVLAGVSAYVYKFVLKKNPGPRYQDVGMNLDDDEIFDPTVN